MDYIRPVEVRLATREDLEALGLESEEIEEILANQEGTPGEIVDTYQPSPMQKAKWGDFNLQE